MLHDISHLAFSYIIQGWYFMAASFNYSEHYSAFSTTMKLNHSIPMPYNLQYLKF